ncbi:MAG: nuclear transport factor 2 family protein [Myxococcales bacterium]|nr:nuclear transport factor 2 family protein [Myxococcales bacterium]
MSQSSNVRVVEEIYAAFGRGDGQAIIDKMHPSVAWERGVADHGIPWILPGNGPAHVGSFLQAVASNLAITRFEVHNIMGNGNDVCALIGIDATVLSTGKALSDEEVHVWTFDPESRVVAFRHVVDTLAHRAASQ